jgi:hypothetical protein
MEVPGLPESEEEDDVDFPIPVKKNTKVTFSTGPIKVSAGFYFLPYYVQTVFGTHQVPCPLTLFVCVKWLGHEADHIPPPSPEVNSLWNLIALVV